MTETKILAHASRRAAAHLTSEMRRRGTVSAGRAGASSEMAEEVEARMERASAKSVEMATSAYG